MNPNPFEPGTIVFLKTDPNKKTPMLISQVKNPRICEVVWLNSQRKMERENLLTDLLITGNDKL